MRRVVDDAAQRNRRGQARRERVADVVLAEFAGAPARDVQLTVVEAQVQVRDQRRYRAEWLERWRQQVRVSGLCGYLDHLAHGPAAIRLAKPGPDRAREILQRD